MEALLTYLLQASLAMVIFFVAYKTILSSSTFYRVNRMLLLSFPLLSMALPLVDLKLFQKPAQIVYLPFESFGTSAKIDSVVTGGAEQVVIPTQITFLEVGFVIFIAGVIFMVSRYLLSLTRLVFVIINSEKQKLSGGLLLCLSNKVKAPFSWMHYIVIPKEQSSEESKAVIAHESAHVKLKHSYDLIFYDLFTWLFWFNPFSWLLRKELMAVHEFQADEQVLEKGIDAPKYQLLLIRKCVGDQKFALANNFNRHNLLKRIKMMNKTKSKKTAKWRYALLLPSLLLALVVLSVTSASASKTEVVFLDDSFVGEPSFSLSDKFEIDGVGPGGNNNPPFGKIDDKSRIVHYGDDGSTFELNLDSIQKKIDAKNALQGTTQNAEALLYVVDGKVVEDISRINPSDIDSIKIVKASGRVQLAEGDYDGVVQFTTKAGGISPATPPVPISPKEFNPIIPDGLTPDGDQVGDYWVIRNIEGFKVNVKIFDRFGKLVFEHPDYNNNWWDGGAEPSGAYFYVISYEKGKKPLSGTLHLFRDDRETRSAAPPAEFKPIVPSKFAPNGDRVDNYWVIRNIEGFKVNVKIFDRFGELVFEHLDYKNNWWDGGDLPAGVYFYVISPGKGQKVVSGPLEIIREEAE